VEILKLIQSNHEYSTTIIGLINLSLVETHKSNCCIQKSALLKCSALEGPGPIIISLV
jgi:hypothetical protein